MKDFDRNLKTHLIRLESKLVRGFEELGINIDKDPDWMSVDDDAGVVYVTTLGRSLMVMLADMKRKGASREGYPYEIVFNDCKVGTIIYSESGNR